MKCHKCGVDVVGRNRENCDACKMHGPRYNANPCHRMDPLVCVMPAGHENSPPPWDECDDDAEMMQFFSGGDEGRYV